MSEDLFGYEISSEFTFENFKVNDSNKELYEAMLELAENIEKKVGPVFVCGSSVYRTQLIPAMYNYLVANKPDMRTEYLTSEKITVGYIKALIDKKAEAFLEQIESIDCLIIDNIEYFWGRQSMLDKFYAIFKKFSDQKKPIILVSDYSTREINKMGERYRDIFRLCESVYVC